MKRFVSLHMIVLILTVCSYMTKMMKSELPGMLKGLLADALKETLSELTPISNARPPKDSGENFLQSWMIGCLFG